MEEPEGKETFRNAKMMGNNIKMNLKEVGCDTGDWIDLAQDRDQ